MKTAKEEKGKKAERKYLFNFNFILFGYAHGYSVARKCLPGLFENRCFSQSGIEIYSSSSVFDKSKFSVITSSGVFMLLASSCRLASSRHNPHVKSNGLGKTGVLPQAAGWKKVLSVRRVQLK